MGPNKCLVTRNLQNFLLCSAGIHTSLEHLEEHFHFWVNYPFNESIVMLHFSFIERIR